MRSGKQQRNKIEKFNNIELHKKNRADILILTTNMSKLEKKKNRNGTNKQKLWRVLAAD